MVIRSTSGSLRTPGLEYVLTYFENAGVVLPQSVTSWVAQKQLPEFLHKLYIATLDYMCEKRQQEQQKKHLDENVVCSPSTFRIFFSKCLNSFWFDYFQCKTVDYFRDPGYEYPPEPEICFSKYKRGGNGDDAENGDDDDDFDDIKSDNKNSSKNVDKHNEMGGKFNTKTGMRCTRYEYQVQAWNGASSDFAHKPVYDQLSTVILKISTIYGLMIESGIDTISGLNLIFGLYKYDNVSDKLLIKPICFRFYTGMATKSQTESQISTDDVNIDSVDDLGAKSISWWRYLLLPFYYFVWIKPQICIIKNRILY